MDSKMESRLPKFKSAPIKSDSVLQLENNILKEQNKADVAVLDNHVNRTKKTTMPESITVNSNKFNKEKAHNEILTSKNKTLTTLVKTNNVAVKRPATVSNTTIANKRVKPNPPKSVQPIVLRKTATVKKIENPTITAKKNNTVAVPSKFAKWDLKGRLAHATDELGTLKVTNKELSAKCMSLEEIVKSQESKEQMRHAELEKLRKTNAVFGDENKNLKIEVKTAKETVQCLDEKLKETSQSLEIVTAKLKDSQEKIDVQKKMLQEQTLEINEFEKNLKIQIELNTNLKNENEELQNIVNNMDKDRRILHNAIQELKGNIRVFCRVRPQTIKESQKGLYHMNFIDECSIEIGKPDSTDSTSCSGKVRGSKQEFSFDKIFSPKASQEDIFQEISLLVQSALEGYNVCIFAYGQTGSGKTYTMEGEPNMENEGMIPRTINHIFREMRQFQLLGWNYKIEASFLEIYNENIVDLLDSETKSHDIRLTDAKGTDLYVTNLTVKEINSPEELKQHLQTAQRNRAVAATRSNERSSRSHSVTRIRLIGTHTRRGETSIGNLNLVDLAGSERLQMDEVERSRTTETKNINKSLANLSNVILALLKKQEHIPYRNSKLTYLLMPSLGGNSKTLMFVNVSPLDENYSETLNSLRFASNVNNCKTGNIKAVKTFS